MGIFNADSSKSKMFVSGKATASFGGVNAILLGVTVNISRQLSPIPTLTDGILWSGQPATGTASAQSILTSTAGKDLLDRMTGASGMCKPQSLIIDMQNSCDSSTIKFTIHDAYCTTVGFSANGNQGYIAEDFQCQFTDVDIT